MNEAISYVIIFGVLAFSLFVMYALFTDKEDLVERIIVRIGIAVFIPLMLFLFLTLPESSKPKSSEFNVKSNSQTSGTPVPEKQLRLDAYHDCLDSGSHSSCSGILRD